MKILAYKGKSLISRLIRWQTRSEYSHIALQFSDFSVLEAWHPGGVQYTHGPGALHTSGTEVDVFAVPTLLGGAAAAEVFALEQRGVPYDFLAIWRFLAHKPMIENGKWFCSELAVATLRAGNLSLLNGEASYFSPRDVAMSPLLAYEKTIVV